MHRIVVVLPAPFGPRKPVTLPGSMPNVSPSTAVLSPYRFVRPRTSIINFILSRLTHTQFWRQQRPPASAQVMIRGVVLQEEGRPPAGGQPSYRMAPACSPPSGYRHGRSRPPGHDMGLTGV